MIRNRDSYCALTPRMALDLAAPHTWPASVIPVLVSVCIAATKGPVSPFLAIICLLIAVLMQSSVNTFNDYYDFVKGTDSEDAYVDEDDAVLVYNNVDPKSALRLALVYLGAAFVLGIACIVAAGCIPLIIALIGGLFVIGYSAGKSPISYLPVGEFASGIVMGGLIPLAVHTVLTRNFDLMVLVYSLPTIIGVGLIMMTNNTSDIERDIKAGRRTLPVLLGRKRARSCYRVALVTMIVIAVLNIAIFFTKGLLVTPFMLLAAYPLAKAIFMNPMTPQMRLQSMPQILSINIVVGAFYAASILASMSQFVLWD